MVTVEVSGRYKSLVSWSLANLSSMYGVATVRKGILSSPLRGVIFCLSVSWMTFEQLLEVLKIGTCLLPVWFSRICSVAVPELWSWSHLCSNIWFAILNSCVFSTPWVFSVVLIAKTLRIFSNLRWSKDISEGCRQTTSRLCGSFVFFVVSGLSTAVLEWRSGVFSIKLRPQIDQSRLYCSVCPVVDSDSVPSVFCSEEAVYLLHWLQKSN